MPFIDMEELAAVPATPSTGRWRVYFKSDGIYIVDDAGAETGPLGSGGGTTGVTEFSSAAAAAKTLASGAFTIDDTSLIYALTGEGSVADILTDINGGAAGDIIIIRGNGSHNITVDNGAGNISLAQAADVVLSTVRHHMVLVYDGSYWCQLENPALRGISPVDLSVTGPGALVQTSSGSTISVETLDEARGGTGQTAYTKGDVIAASGSTTLAKLGIGTDGQVLTADSGEATGLIWADAAGGGGIGTFEGRLTLSTGVPVTTSDVTAATTLYLTPYNGNKISLYDGSSAWSLHDLTEISLSISGLTADTNYDIFVYDSSGLTLEAVAWTNATTRATALALQNGVYVKTGTTVRRYAGTIRINSTGGQCDDALAFRFVWNCYNRVQRQMKVADATASWTYTTATWRQANGAATNQLAYVQGLSENAVEAQVLASAQNSSSAARYVGVGIDSTSTPTQWISGEASNSAGYLPLVAFWRGWPGIGYHYLAWLEYSQAAGTTTWQGTGTAPASGIFGTVWG